MRNLALFALTLLCACAPSLQSGAEASDVELEVEPDVVVAGDSITLELENDTRGQITYNLCSSSIERQVASGWEAVAASWACTRELRILAAGREAHYRLRVPVELVPGTYRFHTGVGLETTGAGEVVRSEPFQVRD